MTRNRHAKEDARQDVELKMLKRDSNGIRDPEHYRGRAVSRCLCDHARREARRRRAEAIHTQVSATTTPPAPAAVAEAREAAAQLRMRVQRLPPVQRDAIAAVYLDELSPREACECLAVSQSALNSALHRGRVNLRRALTPQA